MSTEVPVIFECMGNDLLGIIHYPENNISFKTGVLIVVGGPQYRVGSHRQFVGLARELAMAGFPAMRFDYRGMGDSEGEPISFEDTGPDIKAAIDVFFQKCSVIDKVVLWGLCDAASACLMYSASDPRIAGMGLANPWVRSETGAAKAHLKHYYTVRFFQKQFWLKLLKFEFNYFESFVSLIKNLLKATFSFKRDDLNRDKENMPFQKNGNGFYQLQQSDSIHHQ